MKQLAQTLSKKWTSNCNSKAHFFHIPGQCLDAQPQCTSEIHAEPSSKRIVSPGFTSTVFLCSYSLLRFWWFACSSFSWGLCSLCGGIEIGHTASRSCLQTLSIFVESQSTSSWRSTPCTCPCPVERTERLSRLSTTLGYFRYHMVPVCCVFGCMLCLKKEGVMLNVRQVFLQMHNIYIYIY